eukprot:11458820-Ditylum_brightwellii.AAC.1
MDRKYTCTPQRGEYLTVENRKYTHTPLKGEDFCNSALDFGWDMFDEETKLSKRAIELNNSRASQFGILGLMVHKKLGKIDMAADLSIIGTLQ